MQRTIDPSITSVRPQMAWKGVPRAHSYTTCCFGAEGGTEGVSGRAAGCLLSQGGAIRFNTPAWDKEFAKYI